MRRGGAPLALAIVLWVALTTWTATVALAQDADPSPGVVITTGDPRSDGGGPGIVGSPIEIALGVVLLGVLTIAGTTVAIKVTRR